VNAPAPTEMQLDALREVANVGCGHAASALSRLVGGRRVNIEVPRALVVSPTDLPAAIGGEEKQVVAASLEMTGGLAGHLLLVLPEDDAHRLCALLLNAPGEGMFREDERSAFSEAANIVASACLNAIGKLTGLRLLPSVPKVSQDIAGAVVDEALAKVNSNAGVVVVLEARFSAIAAPPIEGQLLVVPDRASLKRLLETLGV
jgi:chemotaxis protein CheC